MALASNMMFGELVAVGIGDTVVDVVGVMPVPEKVGLFVGVAVNEAVLENVGTEAVIVGVLEIDMPGDKLRVGEAEKEAEPEKEIVAGMEGLTNADGLALLPSSGDAPTPFQNDCATDVVTVVQVSDTVLNEYRAVVVSVPE
jgi:hypothetical protein